MIYHYSNNPIFRPFPAPVVPIELSSCQDQSNTISEDALIDSGASISAITKNIVKRLNLSPIREVTIIGPTGSKTLRVYPINLTFHGHFFHFLSVFCLEEDFNFPIIGRDILNRYNIYLKGPSLKTEIKCGD